ncbi:uncharacterized protein PG986_007604 [Apiospora aurea]|uniref:Uncharacterized protein n=1 Tax=Apiospora aurea TaxID=335848 RepID=A0ABR1QD16_9PEZI
MDCPRTDTPELGSLAEQFQYAPDIFECRSTSQVADDNSRRLVYRRVLESLRCFDRDQSGIQFVPMRDSLEYYYERREEEERQRQRQTRLTSPPRPMPRRVDCHRATLAALEGRGPQRQTPPQHHDRTREVERREPVTTHTRPYPQRQPRPRPRPRTQPRPQSRPRPPVAIREAPIVIYGVSVVIQQGQVVVTEAPSSLTSDLGTPPAQLPKPASMRGPVKKFFKAVARFGRK